MPTILLAVSGMSPAILTETVWALAKETPRVIPDEVIVLTTTAGARDIENHLLAARWGDVSPWTALRRAILGKKAASSPLLQFSAPRVIELPDPKSGVKRPADDLRTPAENAAAADFLLEEVRRHTENPDIRVIASIAGGRKTMGALLYAAMSLLGRETDRLTHVLVNSPYDQCRDFFFPGQPVNPKTPPPGTGVLHSAGARIDLADIPFVPLRNLFERDLARRPGSFETLVAEASRRLPGPATGRVQVRQDTPILKGESFEVRLAVREHVLMLLLAREAIQGHPPFPDHLSAHGAYAILAAELRRNADPNDFSDWRGLVDITTESDVIRKLANGIRTKLKQAGLMGARLAALLESRKGVAFRTEAGVFEIV